MQHWKAQLSKFNFTAIRSLSDFLRHNFNNGARVRGGDGIGVFVFETSSFIGVLLLAVLIALAGLPRRIKRRCLEQPRHESQAFPSDVRLSGEGVEDGVYAAADEGHGGGERSQRRRDRF